MKTQKASKRPYGVGLLIAGIDDDGPHIFETCPSGNFYEYEVIVCLCRLILLELVLNQQGHTCKTTSNHLKRLL